MAAIWLGVGVPLSVGAACPGDGTYCPVNHPADPLLNSSASDILPPTGPPFVYMASGAVTIGAELSDACVVEGGGVLRARTQVLVNGIDYTSALVGDLAWNVRDGDHIVSFPATFRAITLNPLDHLNATAGKTFVVNRIITGEQTLTEYTVPIFTGAIKGCGFTYDKRGQLLTKLTIESESARWDRALVELTLSMEASSYNCVLADVLDECQVVATNPPSATQLRVKAGRVRIDLTQMGRMGNYGGSGSSGTYGWNGGWRTAGWPEQTNGSGDGTYMGGGVFTFDIPDQTVNLLNFVPDLNLTSEDFLGTKSIFVSSNGSIKASDGGAPINGVGLASWEHIAVGDLINDNDLLDIRVLRLAPEQCYRAGVAEYVIRKTLGASATANIQFPTKYNDQVFSNVRITKKSLLTFLDQWFRPSRWKWYFDGSGAFRVVVDEIREVGLASQWTYHQNNSIMIDLAFPEMGDNGLVSDLTIRGQRVINNGIKTTKETTKTKTYGRDEEEGNELGGQYKGYGGPPAKKGLKLMAINEEERTLVGRTTILTETKQFRRRNPIKLRGDAIAGARLLTAPSGPWGSGVSTEWGLGYMYAKGQMELEAEVIAYGVYEGRLKTGFEKQTFRLERLTSSDRNSIGFGGAPVDSVIPGYDSFDERLILSEVDQEFYRLSPSGFVNEIIYAGYRQYNPHDNHEAAAGVSGAATRGAGHYRGDANGTEELIKVLSKTTKYEILRSNPKLLKTTVTQESYGKKAGRNSDERSHGVGDVALGQTQTRVDSKQVEVSIGEGSKPTAETLEDDIERHEVFCQILHPVIDAEFTPTLKVDERVEYVETWEQACRVAHEDMGRRASAHVSIQAPPNALMALYDTADVDLFTPTFRRFQQRTRVVGYGHRVSAKATTPEATMVIAEADYNRMRSFMAART